VSFLASAQRLRLCFSSTFRTSAESRVAQLFPNPLRRPEIESDANLRHVLQRAFRLRAGEMYHFELSVWDLNNVFVDTIDYYDVYVSFSPTAHQH
jgi:hypothetical protein